MEPFEVSILNIKGEPVDYNSDGGTEKGSNDQGMDRTISGVNQVNRQKRQNQANQPQQIEQQRIRTEPIEMESIHQQNAERQIQSTRQSQIVRHNCQSIEVFRSHRFQTFLHLNEIKKSLNIIFLLTSDSDSFRRHVEKMVHSVMELMAFRQAALKKT